MNLKKIVFFASIASVSLIVYLLAGSSFEKPDQRQLANIVKALPLNEKTTSKKQSGDGIVGGDSQSNASASTSSVWNPMGDPASAAEIKKWFAERGNYNFYGPDALSDYAGYDMETLERLGDSGDIKAMHVMADRAKSFDELKKILWKAAIYGSTEALIQLGGSKENDEGSIDKIPVERQKEKILEIMAYYEVAQMRGDWWGNITSAPSLIKRFPVDLSEHDKQLIKIGAEHIYNNLQAQRTELGLGNFDNSVPDLVIKFYEEMLRPL